MSNRTRATAAALPIYLVDVEGVEHEYMMSPLSDRDIAELDEWVRAQHIKDALRACDNSTPEAVQDRLLSVAMTQASGMSWMSGEGVKRMGTLTGMARMVWQSIIRRHPDVKFEDFRAMMFNSDDKKTAARNTNNALAKFKSLNPSDAPKRSGGANSTKTGKHRRKRKSTGRSRGSTGSRRKK